MSDREGKGGGRWLSRAWSGDGNFGVVSLPTEPSSACPFFFISHCSTRWLALSLPFWGPGPPAALFEINNFFYSVSTGMYRST